MSKTKTKPAPPRAQDLTSAQKHVILLSVPCPQCEAPAGQMCRQPSGHYASICHAARYAAVGKFGKDLVQW